MDLDFQRNLGNVDRAIRVGIGALLLYLGAYQLSGLWATLAILAALSQFVEAFFGY